MGRMRKLDISVLIIGIVILIGLASFITFSMSNNSVPVSQPRGDIARQQYDLLMFATKLSLLVVLPLFTMIIWVVYRYRASKKPADYMPKWDKNTALELIWWGIPSLIIIVLSVVTWRSSHSLDPYRPLESSVKPINVQVVALEWRWLFIYPDFGSATINQLKIPEDTPINFAISADAPMNSFWIPQLGGQVYAMNGMSTKLHLIADDQGIYKGVSSNLSGRGFSGMKFDTVVMSTEAFGQWANSSSGFQQKLDFDYYSRIAQPSEDNSVITYSLADTDLYNKIMDKYTTPVLMNKHGGKDADR